MRYTSIIRAFMIVVGITATLVIVLSQALPDASRAYSKKAKTEQSAEQSGDHTIVASPSDVVPGSGPVQMNDADRSLLETLLVEEVDCAEFHFNPGVFLGYFNVLFRAIISPNAP